MSLVPCPKCDRHIRLTETECPFCGVATSRERSRGSRPLAALAGAALAASASLGCGGGGTPPAEPPPTDVAPPEAPLPDGEGGSGGDLAPGPDGEGTVEPPPEDEPRAVPMYGMPQPDE